MIDYDAFLAAKTPAPLPSGLAIVPPLPVALKPFQRAITTWALRRGLAAMFEGTGLGKTLQQLAWAQAVAAEEDAQVLVLTPLAVAEQTVAEAEKFDIPSVAYAPDHEAAHTDIVVTNYERFEKFDIARFAGIVLDESGIIKSQDGKTRAMLTEACIATPWKLCCTATPAPNDYTELGQHAEFLGVMTAKEMLSMFFVHDGSIRANDHSQGKDGWRLKRHAAPDFWRWLASWSVMVRHPSDLGFDDPGYDLPPLRLQGITVAAEYKPTAGMLFPMPARTLGERIGVRRDTIDQRIAAAVEIIGKKLFSDVSSTSCYPKEQRSGAARRQESDTPLIQRDGRQTNEPPPNGATPKPAAPICGPITDPTKICGTSAPRSSATAITPNGGSATPAIPNIATPLNAGPEPSQVVPQLRSAADGSNKSTEFRSNNTTPCLRGKAGVAPFATNGPETRRAAASTSIIATKPELSEACSAQPATSQSANSATTETCFSGPSNISARPAEKWIIWCKLNKEQDRLESMLKDACFSVYGSLPAEEKVARIHAWMRGDRPILLTKPRICGWGLNMQSCAKMIFVGASDSFEETYQAIRRCWRFGQARPVDVYFVASELEGAVVANLRRKEAAFDGMLDAMAGHMRDLMRENVVGGRNASALYNPQISMEIPAWLTA